MTGIIDALKGKKTYIVGALMIVLGFLQGENELIMQGIGFMTVRAGIAKVGKTSTMEEGR